MDEWTDINNDNKLIFQLWDSIRSNLPAVSHVDIHDFGEKKIFSSHELRDQQLVSEQ